MRSSFDYYKQIESPEMYLCNPDQRFLCALNGESRHLALRFNDLSELTFTVPKIAGTESSYDLIESKRLIYVDKIGWFQISGVSETIEGDKYTKSVTAQSHQAVFSNRGFVTEEKVYMFYNPNDPLDEKYDWGNNAAIPSVVGQLYQQLGVKVALSNSDIEPTYDRKEWTIVYIDPILKFRSRSYDAMYESAAGAENICRSFEANEESNGYDFMVNEVENAFEVIFDFDFLYHTIKVKTLDEITKPTNIYLSFENVINNLKITENAEDIVTVMSCEGSDLDIRTVNPMGTNYIVDFSYYKKLVDDNGLEYPWMSRELIEALDEWEIEFERWRVDDAGRTGHTKGYSTLVTELQELYTQKVQFEKDREFANLKLKDMQVARDQYISGDDKPLDGSGYITAESVNIFTAQLEAYDSTIYVRISGGNMPYDKTFQIKYQVVDSSQEFTTSITVERGKTVGKVHIPVAGVVANAVFTDGRQQTYFYGNSMLPGSTFYTTPFTDTVTIVGHVEAAKPTKVVDSSDGKEYHYEFAFDDAGVSGTPRSFIDTYIDSERVEDNSAVPFYFMDNNNRSYCKLTVASEVGVVKDADGFISEEGTVEVRGVTFRVSAHSGVYEVTLPNGTTITRTQSNSYFVYPETNGTRYRVLSGSDGIVTIYAFYISGFERYTTYTETRGNDGWCTLWENHINGALTPAINALNDKIDEIAGDEKKGILGKMGYIKQQCDIQLFVQRKSQELYGNNKLYNELSDYWIEGGYTNNNFAAYDSTTMGERIGLANELLDAAKKDLVKSAQPQFQMTVDAINFIKMIEFRRFTDELALGKVITIEKEDGVHYRPALMTLEYDLDQTENFIMTFSNASKPGETSMTFADLIKESTSASRTVTANWSNLMDYSRNKAAITSLIDDPLDRTLRAAKENMAAQAFIIDNTGILGRKYSDDSETAFSDKQLRIMNNIIIFTDNNWESAKTALGEITLPNGNTSYGLVAETIIGNLILGDNVVASNNDGSVVITGNGIVIKNQNNEVVLEALNNGNITIKNYASQTDLDALGTRVGSAETLIEANAQAITLKASQTDLDALGTRVGSAETSIQQNASDITACARKTVGNETSAFSYSLTAAGFTLNNNGEEVFSCDGGGVTITGNITADTGSIAGLIITQALDDNDRVIRRELRSKNDEFNISVDYDANNVGTTTVASTLLKCDAIQARHGDNFIDLCYSGNSVDITATLTCSIYHYEDPDAPGGGDFTDEPVLTVSLTQAVLRDTTFSVQYDARRTKWASSEYTTTTEYVTVTIRKGQTSGSTHGMWIDSYRHPTFSNFKFTESNSNTLNFTSVATTDAAVGVMGTLIPETSGGGSIGHEDSKWNNGYFNNGYFSEVLKLGNNPVAAPYHYTTSVGSLIYESSGATPDNFTATSDYSPTEVIVCGNMRIITIKSTHNLASDKWYRVYVQGVSGKIISACVNARGGSGTSLSGNTHGGSFCVYNDDRYIYIGMDTNSCTTGFIATVVSMRT